MNVKKVPNSCWEWQKSLTKSGYGRFAVHPKTYRAHIVSHLLLKGEIPEGKFVCHSCDNPKCVNPEHLWLGSAKENTRDMINKGRLVRSRSKNSNRSSKYIGVSFRKETGKWRARIMKNYTNFLVGDFETEELAKEARERALASFSTL